MEANEAPEKIYLPFHPDNGNPCYRLTGPKDDYIGSVEYTRTDAFIEKAAEYLYNYNQKQVLKHGARATLGCGEHTINVDEFRKYMKGE